MALLLYQRGLLILHASAVNINGCATAFMGYPGSGKSSLAAALFTRGHNVITDDVTALDMDNKTVKVFPGFPQLKLSLEVAELLGHDTKDLIVLSELDEKRGYRFVNKFINVPMPLSRIYVLAEEADPGIESLSPQEAVIEFIRHSVPTRFAQPGNAVHLLQCVELAKKAATFRVKRSSSIQVLPDLAKLVEGHIVESS